MKKEGDKLERGLGGGGSEGGEIWAYEKEGISNEGGGGGSAHNEDEREIERERGKMRKQSR